MSGERLAVLGADRVRPAAVGAHVRGRLVQLVGTRPGGLAFLAAHDEAFGELLPELAKEGK